MAGQTATFSATASGPSLSYQWQRFSSGATTGNNISGATSSAYTTPSTTMADNGTQFRCVITNAQGSVTTNAVTLTVLPSGTSFVTSSSLGTLRNNYSGWVGINIAVGSQPLVVSSMGRMIAPGNSGAHATLVQDRFSRAWIEGPPIIERWRSHSLPGTSPSVAHEGGPRRSYKLPACSINCSSIFPGPSSLPW